MTNTVSSGTLNSTIPYHTISALLAVCTAYCALQTVIFTLRYILFQEQLKQRQRNFSLFARNADMSSINN